MVWSEPVGSTFAVEVGADAHAVGADPAKSFILNSHRYWRLNCYKRKQEARLKIFKFLGPAAIMVCGLILNTTASFGKPEYTKKEKKACTACHVKMPVKDKKDTQALNDIGKCYEKSHSLENCK